MGSQPFCDRCKKPVATRWDLFDTVITNCASKKPAMPEKEVCTWCKEEIKEFIESYREKADRVSP